ncbi:MAG TPA: amino acid permease [Gammaproteobacteria bacterium]|nr:amino acid permease [Gammaproteobacteria bacterium]
MSRTANSAEKQQPSLKRALSLPLVTFYGLGNILGAGIYVLIGKVVAYAGIFAPVSFLVAALLACLSAFAYAELAARFPLSAGEAVYVQEGIGIRSVSALVGLLIILAGIVSAATILRGFTGYLQVFLPVHDAASLLVLVILLGGLAAWGISESVLVAAFITVIEIIGLLLIIGIAAPELALAQPVASDFSPLLEIGTWQGIFVGGFLAFYAFIGFEDMVNVAEEVQHPRRNLPRAILIALAVSSLLYFLVALAAVSSVPGEQLAASDAPLAFMYAYVTGREPVLITIISMFAVINGALIQIIMASRVCYGMSRKRWLPAVFAKVHTVTRTPVIATLSVALLVLIMALWLPLETLAKATSYFLLVVFSLINLSLWRLKRLGSHPAGVICVPYWVPITGFFASTIFVGIQLFLDLMA